MKKLLLILGLLLLFSGAIAFAQDATEGTDAADETTEAVDDSTADDTADSTDTEIETDAEETEEDTSSDDGQMEASKLDPKYQRKARAAMVNGARYVNSDVFFKLSAKDEGTGVQAIQYAIDSNNYIEYTSPFNVLIEGNHIISYRGIDNGENMEEPETYQIVVDNSAPNTMMESDQPLFKKDGKAYCSPRTNFFIGAKDAATGAGVDLAYGGYSIEEMYSAGNGERVSNNFFTLEGTGEVIYYYAAMDKVGNLSDINQCKVYVDNQAPVASLVGSTNLKNVNGEYLVIPSDELKTEDGKVIVSNKMRLAFEAEDDLSGVKAIYVKVNDEDYIKYHEALELANMDSYTIMVKTEDNVGNISDPVEFKFSVDYRGPESELEMISSDGSKVEGNVDAGAEEDTSAPVEDTETTDEENPNDQL